MTACLAIDANACMRYIPGTHRLGHLTYTLSENDAANVLNQTVPDAETLGEPVDVELEAGEISIHSDLLLHGSEANQSTRRRCGLTLRYCPTDVRAGLGWNAKGVIVSGVDESGHWANPPRPETDLIIASCYNKLWATVRTLENGFVFQAVSNPSPEVLCPQHVLQKNWVRLAKHFSGPCAQANSRPWLPRLAYHVVSCNL